MDDNLTKKVEEINKEESARRKNKLISFAIIGGSTLFGILIAILCLIVEITSKDEINVGLLVGIMIVIIVVFAALGVGGYFLGYKLIPFIIKKSVVKHKINKEKREKENIEKAAKIEEKRKNTIDADFVLELGKGYYRQGNIINGTRKEVLNRALFMNTSTKMFQILYPDYPEGTGFVGIDVKITEALPYDALIKYEKSENIKTVEHTSGSTIEHKHSILETGINASSHSETKTSGVNLDSIKIIIYLKSKEHSVVVFTIKNEQDALRLQVKLDDILKENSQTKA